ncbi:conserved domain protein, partial [delta proteobacterium NaphS2]
MPDRKEDSPTQPKEKPRFPFSEEDWANTPATVQQFLLHLVSSHITLEKRIEELEKRLNKNSSNSSKPPSSDNPFEERPKKQKKNKSKKKKRRKGFRQKMLEPTEVNNIVPEACICGNSHFDNTNPYYTHQVIELPEIKMEVTHFILHKGECPCCGKINKAVVPNEHRTGFGPRLSAMIAQMAGNMGDSRTIIQDYCSSVLGFHISLGAIQKVIDRASEAIKPHYESIGKEARDASVNYIDETSHRLKEKLQWLWVM